MNISEKYVNLDRKSLIRKCFPIKRLEKNKILLDKKLLTNFSSNDYLGISTDTAVKKSFAEGAYQYGLGSGSSAQVSGYSYAHQALEAQFSEFLNRERALLFNTGYQANLAALTTLANRNSNIIADKHIHASLIDGILLSRAKYHRYPHQNIYQAVELIKHVNNHRLLITEGIFSIDGSLTNLKLLKSLLNHYPITLIVDDAHGIGWLGENGSGSCEYHHLSSTDVDCLITPLGKAFGSMGAIVSGNAVLIEALLQGGRSHRYTTALPAAICHATSSILNIIRHEKWRRQKLQHLIQFFVAEVNQRSLPLLSDDLTPIKSIPLKSSFCAYTLQTQLIESGYLVGCIRPPTVIKKNTCIRISLNCWHEESQIIHLLDLIATYYEKLKKTTDSLF